MKKNKGLSRAAEGVKTLIRVIAFASIMIIATAVAVDVRHSIAAGARPAAGKASGTLTIDGKGITLNHAYAMAQPNTFDADKTDIAVLLTEKPLAEGALRDIEQLEDAVRKGHSWVFFKINEEGTPIHEVIDHPAAGGNRLIMSGFTQAKFVSKKMTKDGVEGSFVTVKAEDFLDHTYEIKVDFSAPVLQAKRPDPLPDAKTGKALPQDGGEPGEAYRAYLKAIRDKDIAALRKMAPAQEPEMSDSELQQGVELMAALSPSDQKITRGYVKGDRAVLYLEGTFEGEKQFGTVELVRKGPGWMLEKEHWSNTPPKK